MLEQLYDILTQPHGNCVFAIAPALLALIMAGAQYGKSELVDKPRADKERQTQAEMTRWSPWTGIRGKDVAEPDSLGAAMQGGFAGYSLGQNIGTQEEEAAMRKELLQSLKNKNKSAWMDLSAMNTNDPYTIG